MHSYKLSTELRGVVVLKSILFYIMALFVGVRFVSIIYLMAVSSTYLPRAVVVLMSLIVLYGIILILKKFVFGIRLKEIIWFFMAQAAVVAFNLGYMMFIGYPLQLSLLEVTVVGTFLDLLTAACVLYYGIKQMRRTNLRETGKKHV